MSYFVPTRFVWRFGGRQVHLCGSFTRWVETVPMAPVEGSSGVFAVVVHLPPGYHQYKFIVDGRWRHDETAPFMPDPLGNVNNWLFVRRIDASVPTTPNSSPMPLEAPVLTAQQQAQQQAAAAAAAQAVAAAQAQLLHQQQAALLHPSSNAPVVPSQPTPLPPHLLNTALGVSPVAVQQQQQQHQQHQQLQQHQQHSSSHLLLQQQQQQQALAQQLQQHQLHNVPPELQHQQAPNQHQRGSNSSADVDMANADSTAVQAVPPTAIHNPKEPEYTRKKIADFLHSHTAYELIPESGRVVVLDMDLPVRQAFHALHEQGTASAPLWDASEASIAGVISASDFIHILKRLRSSVSSGANPMSEAEMDAHTIRGLREEALADGRESKGLVFVRPDDDLAKVVATLFNHKCSMAPVLLFDSPDTEIPSVLHLATLSGVLACLMRHFRASLASLPLLAQPLGSLPLGTWSPDAVAAHSELLPDSKDRRQWKKLQPLHTITPTTPLTAALSLLLEAGVSALPVVDERRTLLDIYARSEITALCKGNAYNRLQWEDVTVGQALSLSSGIPAPWETPTPPPTHTMHSASSAGGLSIEFAQQQSILQQQAAVAAAAAAAAATEGRQQQARVFLCTKDDSLRTVVERLAIPGVRRLIVVHPESRRVEGVISLSDVAAYLFL